MESHIQTLPPEILVHIFSYIEKKELVTTIPHVCQYWNDLSTDPTLYRHFHFSGTNPETSTALALIDVAPRLKTFRMTNRSDTDQLILHLIQNRPDLKRLEIHNCRGRPNKKKVSSFGLRCLLKNCNNIQYLSLKKTCCMSKQFYDEIGLKLPLLNFGNAGNKFSSEALLNIVANCRGVQEFRVNGKQAHVKTVSNTTVRIFCDTFRASLRIAKFKASTTWTDESLASVSRCHHLSILYLRDASLVTDEGVMSIVDMPALVDLGLENANLVTSQGWIRLLENSFLSRLQRLFISGDNIGDDVLKTVKSLTNLTDLAVYDLNGCTDVSMNEISTLKNLIFIDLSNLQQVTDKGIMTLADLPNIKYLYLCFPDQITTHCWINFFRMPFVKKITHLGFDYCENLNDEVAKVLVDNLRDLRELKLHHCFKITTEGCCYVRQTAPVGCIVTFDDSEDV